jgi:hypothetical protein
MRCFALTAVALALSLGCSAPPPANPPVDEAAERAAVEAAITQWFETGLATGDTAVVGRYLAPGFAILEDSIWYDRPGFLGFVSSLPSLVGGPFTIRYSLSEWKTNVQGDVAWTSLRNRAVLKPEAGDSLLLDWRETVVLQKIDGSWLINRYQSAPVR